MNDPNCLFCKMIRGEIPVKKAYEDEQALVFHDISPKAPVHLLAVPKQHFAGVHDVPAANAALFAGLFSAVGAVVRREKLDETGGYRLVVNSGENAGQAVAHIHVHILSGRTMAWPPG